MSPSYRIFATISLAATVSAVPGHAGSSSQTGEFAQCDDAGAHPSLYGTECTLISAPLEHADPDKGSVQLFVRKFPALGNAEGELWLVAGGPGESGASFYPFVETLRAAAPGLDLIVPDHRGTGFSTRLCPLEESPTSDGGTALVDQEWGTCFGALSAEPERTRSFTISNAAHDLLLLMSHVDTKERRYLYGVSYGTQLVLRAIALGSPEHLNGIILDSLIPHETDRKLDLSHRSAVADRVGRQFLRECDQTPACSRYFPDSAETAVSNVLARQDIQTLVGPRLKYHLTALLDFPETRSMLPNIIAGLQAGDPAWFHHALGRLTHIASGLEPYAQSGSSIPLANLISRSENTTRPGLTAAVIESEARDYLFASPLPSLLLAGGIPTYEPDAQFGISPRIIPRTIVLHGTLDPKTHFSGAQQHVSSLKSAGNITLAPVRDAPHFILLTAPDEFARLVREFIEVDSAASQANGG